MQGRLLEQPFQPASAGSSLHPPSGGVFLAYPVYVEAGFSRAFFRMIGRETISESRAEARFRRKADLSGPPAEAGGKEQPAEAGPRGGSASTSPVFLTSGQSLVRVGGIQRRPTISNLSRFHHKVMPPPSFLQVSVAPLGLASILWRFPGVPFGHPRLLTVTPSGG